MNYKNIIIILIIAIAAIAGLIFLRGDKTAGLIGTIHGKVYVGPICPVEQEDVPCPAPPGAYTSRQVVIYKANTKTEVTRMAINPDGTYSFDLAPGQYVLDITYQGVDYGKDLPHSFVISDGETQKFDFSIDTGIR